MMWRPRGIAQRVLLSLAAVAIVIAAFTVRGSGRDDLLSVKVERGSLHVTLTETGTLRPAEALVYRSRVPGKEIEITWLAPEGTRVREGDPVVRLDTTELATDLERANQARQQAKIDLQAAEAEGQAASASLDALDAGKGGLDVDEARFAVRIAELKASRLKKDYESLAPLLAKGYVTREELDRAALEVEQAEGEAAIARRRVTVLSEQTAPRERQRAALDVAHRTNQIDLARQRLEDATSRVSQLRGQIDSCTMVAQHAGLVVYEDNLSSSPPRKVRPGDRVTPSQGLITIPEVTRMLVDASLREADLHRVKPNQRAVVTLDAFPDTRLSGRVISVGAVAKLSTARPFDGKRFDVIVELDPTQLDLRPEMTARIDITVADRQQVLLVPVTAVFERSGAHVVHVVHGGRIEVRPVTVGQSDDMRVEIVGGLRGDERVRLIDDGDKPTDSTSEANAPASRTP